MYFTFTFDSVLVFFVLLFVFCLFVFCLFFGSFVSLDFNRVFTILVLK